jgi:hypothetical protein
VVLGLSADRVKAVLDVAIERYRCTEDEAYRMLRRLAVDKNLKLSNVALRALDVAGL